MKLIQRFKERLDRPPTIRGYLAGPMESKRVYDHGMTWRQVSTVDLVKLGEALRLDFQVFDPSREESVLLGTNIARSKHQKDQWRRDNQYIEFQDKMGRVIELELAAINASDFVIVRWPNETPSIGTRDEEAHARLKVMVPLALLFTGDPAETNRWKHRTAAPDFLDEEIYYSWSQILADIADHYRDRSWLSIRLEGFRRRLLVRWRLFLWRLFKLLSFPEVLSSFPATRSSDAFRGAVKEARNARDVKGAWVVPQVVFSMGPPNSGKSTVSRGLARAFPGFVHIETSELIKTAFSERGNDPNATVEFGGKVYSITQEKETYKSGKLNDYGFVVGLIKEELLKLPRPCRGIVFSGSPRRDKEAAALIPAIEELFPYVQITVFQLQVSPEVALKRASGRDRAEGFDTPEKQAERLAIYNEDTMPVLQWLAEHGYPPHILDTSALTEQEVLSRECALLGSP